VRDLEQKVKEGIRASSGEDRKQAEWRLCELAAIIQNSEDAIISMTLTGIVMSWNVGARRLFGYRAEEMIAQPITRIIPEDRLKEENDILARLRRGERLDHFETVRRRSDGSLIDVSLAVSPIWDASGNLIGASKIAHDITAQKKVQQGLLDSQARFQGIIDSAMDAIITIDESQRVVLFNTAAERMFGCAATEALGETLDRFIPSRFREAHRLHVQNFGATGATSRAMGKLKPLTAIRADGREFPIEASISQTKVGATKLFTVILRDITERKAAQEALSRSEEQLRALAIRLQRAREEEASRIARELHDQLGRYLTMIKMDVLLIDKIAARQPSVEDIHSIGEKARMMLEALDETVQVVRKIATELRPGILDDLGLAAAVDWQAKEFERRAGVVSVVRVTEEDLDLSREQATAFFRIFQEILTNVARHAKAERIWINLESQEGTVALEVEDDGVGIASDAVNQPQALGLLGMRERAAIFGGHVEISGTHGKGTTVIVRMPINENSAR
jgi:PAS domain S-box-containing protein